MNESSLGRWPIHCHDIQVAWGEMDAFGHVNNGVYLRWFETARIAYFSRTISTGAAAGAVSFGQPKGVGPILAHASIDFRIPLTFPDRITASSTVTKLGTTSFSMKYRVTSASHAGAIAAEGAGVIVMVDYQSGEKVALSAALRDSIVQLEASAT